MYINLNSDEPIFWDTETCGLHGPPVLLQYCLGYGAPVLHDLWHEPIEKTIALIEAFVNHEGGNVLFNATFDIFTLYKFYTMLKTIGNFVTGDARPVDYIDELGVAEKMARDYDACFRFKGLVDIMLVAQQGKYQAMMDRKEIRIRRVPVSVAELIADHLEKALPFSPIYFARRANKKARKWKVSYEEDTEFPDIVVTFAPSKALKVLAVDAGLVDAEEVLSFADVDLPKTARPVEYGWAPFARAGVLERGLLLETGPDNWRGTWPEKIKLHIDHWRHNDLARKYAELDPVYTRGVWEHLGKPPMNDTNSQLANMVACCRWSGFTVDSEQLKLRRNEAIVRAQSCRTDWRAVKEMMRPLMHDTEFEALNETGTGKVALEAVAEWPEHPAAEVATKVLAARSATKEVENFDKLIHASRFHASFKVIGTFTDRMSGTDGLNAQGIKATKDVRRCFTLGDKRLKLSSGDFDAFEVSIAEAVYNDPALRTALTEGVECPECYGLDPNCSLCGGQGKVQMKIHTLFAKALYPHLSFKEIMDSKGQEKDYYNDGKRGIFAMFYGGNDFTLQERIGVDEDVAKAAFENFAKMFPGVGAFMRRIHNDYCSMTQPQGVGTKVIWKDPKDYVESIFGFKRFFTVENQVTKTLFDLACNTPEHWLKIDVKVKRRDRIQKAGNAAQSALYAAAFGIQGKCLRAAANHVIQSPGAHITKALQCSLWNLQPVGVNPWKIKLLNVHDEVNCCAVEELNPQIGNIVTETVEFYKKDVPLLEMTWKFNLQNWAEK